MGTARVFRMRWALVVVGLVVMGPLLGRTLHLEPIIPAPAAIGLGTSCLDEAAPSRPDGTLEVVPGKSEPAGEGGLITFFVEVERGLPIDPDCFARVVELTLGDRRGWTAGGRSFSRIDSGSPGLRVTLASPDTVDASCYPLITGGIYSCWNGYRAMLNFDRWSGGAFSFDGDLVTYRTYQINHEVGHGLGRDHRDCPGEGEPAPLMMQQTKSVGVCVPNGWPTLSEL